ncbi:hypothetical protein F0562_023595 [Nyssa sinensis]|uniref:G-patch domain-containing protein n=1 Tax=Nyssa sinensis TaxID=561372 RepID=A0A5J5BHP2_9ASTE|nr:hypothetical protein F0562_023595 [Nyssa sinensis]
MAGSSESGDQELQKNECGFEWDDKSQLYFHASTGFYYDPSAGWYYSSRDGLYYKFENGNYVLLESDKGDQSEINQCGGTVSDEPATIHTECMNDDLPENPPPPSEWLEDTLIDLYLSGYSNQVTNVSHDTRIPEEADDGDSLNLLPDGAGNDELYELEEGEWIPDDSYGATDSSGSVLDEGTSWDEENWRAQYGQVIESGEESLPNFPVVDLWDWAMVTGTRKDGKGQVARLVGRLVRRSVKLHPSMPSGGGLFKTAPICQVHLDLVRVTSGQFYKLRSPRAGYLATLTTYDSSNPTKDWGFPELSIDRQIASQPKTSGNSDSKIERVPAREDLSVKESGKHGSRAYRDRAAERRALHGGFGVGPGQKKSTVDSASSSPVSDCPEEAAAESLNISFGAGSYARRILESMGWKEGEALGSSMKGLTEPLQAVGNKGNAGLGWDQSKRSR